MPAVSATRSRTISSIVHVSVSFDIRITLDPVYTSRARQEDKSYEFVEVTSDDKDDDDDDKQCGDKKAKDWPVGAKQTRDFGTAWRAVVPDRCKDDCGEWRKKQILCVQQYMCTCMG